MSEVSKIEIDQIVIRDRARDVNADWAAVLAASIKESEMLNPITLWRDDGEAVLVAGLHRIEAHLINGVTEIECRFVDAKTHADARILETSENLLRHELTALDRAHHLAELKDAYEAKHPEAKQGGDRKSDQAKKNQNGIIPFWSDASDATGLSGSAITKAVAMWNGLSASSRAIVKGTWLADHQAGLMQLSKENHVTQAKALDMIFPPEGLRPTALNVADALYAINGGEVLTSQEKKLRGIKRTLTSLKDHEFDSVMRAHEDRIVQWVKDHVEGAN